MRIAVLVVFPVSSGPVFNCKAGTAVQAAKAHDALVPDPHRLLIPHCNRPGGAFAGTQAASDAGVCYVEIIRLLAEFSRVDIFDRQLAITR